MHTEEQYLISLIAKMLDENPEAFLRSYQNTMYALDHTSDRIRISYRVDLSKILIYITDTEESQLVLENDNPAAFAELAQAIKNFESNLKKEADKRKIQRIKRAVDFVGSLMPKPLKKNIL